jgi:hypothetical protein
MTKPGFVLSRIKLLFNFSDLKEQNRIIRMYNNFRNKQSKKKK